MPILFSQWTSLVASGATLIPVVCDHNLGTLSILVESQVAGKWQTETHPSPAGREGLPSCLSRRTLATIGLGPSEALTCLSTHCQADESTRSAHGGGARVESFLEADNHRLPIGQNQWQPVRVQLSQVSLRHIDRRRSSHLDELGIRSLPSRFQSRCGWEHTCRSRAFHFAQQHLATSRGAPTHLPVSHLPRHRQKLGISRPKLLGWNATRSLGFEACVHGARQFIG